MKLYYKKLSILKYLTYKRGKNARFRRKYWWYKNISSLWFSIFKEKTSKEDKKEKYFCQRNWNSGVWYYTKEWFLVLKWSVWSFEIKEYALSALKNIQQKLFLENILKQENEKIIFLQDYLFSSPSTASSIIIWNKSNGWIDWKTENWKTLHEIERKNKNI